MTYKTSIMKTFAISVVLVFLLMGTLTNAHAYKGKYTSGKSKDWDGMSNVWTTYSGGGNSSETVKLIVKQQSGANIGSKTVGCTVDQLVQHICWGQPLLQRWGIVDVKSSIYHQPGFYS